MRPRRQIQAKRLPDKAVRVGQRFYAPARRLDLRRAGLVAVFVHAFLPVVTKRPLKAEGFRLGKRHLPVEQQRALRRLARALHGIIRDRQPVAPVGRHTDPPCRRRLRLSQQRRKRLARPVGIARIAALAFDAVRLDGSLRRHGHALAAVQIGAALYVVPVGGGLRRFPGLCRLPHRGNGFLRRGCAHAGAKRPDQQQQHRRSGTHSSFHSRHSPPA